MKFAIFGFFIGALLAFIPFTSLETADSLLPSWHGKATSLSSIKAASKRENSELFRYQSGDSHYLITSYGRLIKSFTADAEHLDEKLRFSYNNRYYARYQKVGTSISLHTLSGERLWVINAAQYPYLSPNNELLLLLVSDLNTIHVRDKNGAATGIGELNGRFCSAIDFAIKSDHAAIGYLSSHYFILNKKGELVLEGQCPKRSSVKSIAISANGFFALVHYGTAIEDGIRIIDIENSIVADVALGSNHKTRTGLAIDDSGQAYIIDSLFLRKFSKKGKELFAYEITPQKPGQAVIEIDDKLVAVAYRIADEKSVLYILTEDGTLYLHRVFKDYALDLEIKDQTVLVKGTSNLAAWHFASTLEPETK